MTDTGRNEGVAHWLGAYCRRPGRRAGCFLMPWQGPQLTSSDLLTEGRCPGVLGERPHAVV